MKNHENTHTPGHKEQQENQRRIDRHKKTKCLICNKYVYWIQRHRNDRHKDQTLKQISGKKKKVPRRNRSFSSTSSSSDSSNDIVKGL